MEAQVQKQAKREAHAEASLAHKLGRISMLMHRYHTTNARRHGAIGDPLRGQGRVLALLVAKPETTQRELSYLLDMRQQSLSELLAKLEDKGYVTREKSAQDGRVTVVKLTEAGAAAAPSPEEMERRDDVFDCLTDEERIEFERIVDKLNATLETKLVALGVDPYAPPRRRGPEAGGPRPPRDFGPEAGPHGHREPHGPHGPRRPHREHRGWDDADEPLRQA